MVDKLLYCDSKRTKTAFTVRADSIFLDNGVLAEAGLIENVAQTCAARVGNIGQEGAARSVKIGFIGLIRNFEIGRLPELGETLVTEVNLIEEIFQISLVHATVTIGDEVIASCEMKTSLIDKEV